MKYIPKGMTRIEYEQRYILRHIVNTVALAYFVMLAVQLLWEFYFIKIFKTFGIPFNVLQELVADPATSLVLNVVITGVIFTVPFIAVLSRERTKVKRLIGFGMPDKKYFVPLVLMGVGGCMLANFAGNYITGIFSLLGIENEQVLSELPQGTYGVIISYLTVSVAPALLEEFAWRGVTMNLLRRGGDTYALFVSAAFFGVMHLNMTQIPFAFIVGLILGFAYIKSGSFWTGAVIHFINNAVSVTLDYATKGMNNLQGNMTQAAVMLVEVVLGFIGLLIYIKRGGSFKLQNRMVALSNGKKAKITLAAPLIIVDIIVSAIVVIVL